uniref:Uncharacterized protein n=1 Tax=Pipistrellus kuhlii TaxID=59472 RepID=A0A7J7XAP4_PIPKU|nr:hypothetical protein mPipKuh1_010581 [Pipistrellus kuhlii]
MSLNPTFYPISAVSEPTEALRPIFIGVCPSAAPRIISSSHRVVRTSSPIMLLPSICSYRMPRLPCLSLNRMCAWAFLGRGTPGHLYFCWETCSCSPPLFGFSGSFPCAVANQDTAVKVLAMLQGALPCHTPS